MLFTQNGEPWKELRSKLSPTFTTGKIKRLFARFDQSGKKFVKFLETEVQNSREGDIELTEGYSKYTMDVIASAVCGMDSRAFDQKPPSTFEKMGKHITINLGLLGMLKLVFISRMPKKIVNFLRLSNFGFEAQHFFSKAIKFSIADRQSKNEKRDDFIELMLDAREGKLKTDENELESFELDAIINDVEKIPASEMLDDDGIVSNCVLFIMGGFDTTQALLLFCTYEIARNQDVQERLRVEIENALKTSKGQFTYDAISSMVYLDMIINETLRLWPPAILSDRLCTKDYKVPGTDFVLKKGEAVDIPVYGLHMDPDIFPNPQKFDPERFSPENKGNIDQYTYMPFSQGPRNCIGMRFALAETKVVISQLVRNFKIQPSRKTLIPMKFDNSIKPKGGLFLSLTKIKCNFE